MSFSADVKKELAAAKNGCSFCLGATLYGMLLYGKCVQGNKILFSTESDDAAELFATRVIEMTGAILTIHEPESGKRPFYMVTVEDSRDVSRLIDQFELHDTACDKGTLNRRFFPNPCCMEAFLRGVYLACGSMSDPQKEYHLEFRAPNEALAQALCALLLENNLHFKVTSRAGQMIVYAKESAQIEDTLTRIGAVHSTMSLMNLKIEKEMRNQVNRVTNCETANIEKTVNAAFAQVQKIKYIKDTVGFDSLPIPLQEAALLRLANPDATLSELCRLSGGTVSRSGMNHRLSRLSTIADELRESFEE